MQYTKNYNLCKPDYDDTIDVNFLNQNMDVLDNTVSGLNYVQNVNTSDNGLTFIKRDGQQIDVPLNYLKLTGGNITGDLTVQNNKVESIVSITKGIINNGYVKWVCIKYSSGIMIQTYQMAYDANFSGSQTIIFPTPFKDVDTMLLSYGIMTTAEPISYNVSGRTHQNINFTTTMAYSPAVDFRSRQSWHIQGFWK